MPLSQSHMASTSVSCVSCKANNPFAFVADFYLPSTVWSSSHVKCAALRLFLSTWWWQLPAGHLIHHSSQWPPCPGCDGFCLFVFLACSTAFLAGFLAWSLKAKCESSKHPHLGEREKVWHISLALILSKLLGEVAEAGDTFLTADMFGLQGEVMKEKKWVESGVILSFCLFGFYPLVVSLESEPAGMIGGNHNSVLEKISSGRKYCPCWL